MIKVDKAEGVRLVTDPVPWSEDKRAISGASSERARIVEWLRGQEAFDGSADAFADMIEQGVHV